jgi:acetylornithine deacetylase/succinyl-diaminopimelate desuccinylase-like protein
VSFAQDRSSEHARKTLEIYRTIVEVDTSKLKGNTPKVAQYLADELIAAGFPAEDVEVVLMPPTAALIARYRGSLSSAKKPILLLGHMDVVEANAEDWVRPLLGHMDVVEANAEDWVRPPFELTQDEDYFYARGAIDNKFGIAQLTSTFIRLKQEGFVPNRDLILAFSGDEESGMITTRMLAHDVAVHSTNTATQSRTRSRRRKRLSRHGNLRSATPVVTARGRDRITLFTISPTRSQKSRHIVSRYAGAR